MFLGKNNQGFFKNILNKMIEKISVKFATKNDIESIVAICSEKLVENNKQKMTADDFSKNGFLMSKITKKDVENMIENENDYVVLLAKNSLEAVGYLTACDSKKAGDFKKKIESFDQLKGKKVLYYKQIARKNGEKNVGNSLINKMLSEAVNRGYNYVICQIVHEPFFNNISAAFHEKYGFKKIGFEVEEARKLGIYLKKL